MKDVYSSLSVFCDVQLKFKRAENLTYFGENESALKYIQEKINSLRNIKETSQFTEIINFTSLDIKTIILNYRNIIEREEWLLLGKILMKLDKIRDAEAAFWEVLKHEPQDPRAYSGLFEVCLKDGNKEAFDGLIKEAQNKLRMQGWVDFRPCGYPNQFFNEKELLIEQSNLRY